MASRPLELELQLKPRARCDIIDVPRRVRDEFGDVLGGYRRVLYCSLHTTAGYVEQSFAHRLRDRRERVGRFIGAFQGLFPHRAGYRHDAMDLRRELSEEQRRTEPPNGDAHLTFIGCGLQSCVTYDYQPGVPVYFMDLDGVYRGRARTRQTSLVAYDHEEVVAGTTVDVPVTNHAIDSVNLSAPDVGVLDRVGEMLRREGVETGRVDLELDGEEEAAAITVNEYETLLMRHDLAEVLADPLRFMARQGRRVLSDPRAVPAKSLGYARYDVVQVLNEVLDVLGLSQSAVERIVARVMAFPASRILRLKRSVSLAVSRAADGEPRLVRGRYQSPILIQWRATNRRRRALRITLSRFR